jgi:hypothetical protein
MDSPRWQSVCCHTQGGSTWRSLGLRLQERLVQTGRFRCLEWGRSRLLRSVIF